MKRKIISMVFLLVIIIGAIIGISKQKPSFDIDITMSTVVKHADLKNKNLLYSSEYPDDYEKKSGFIVYNYYLKIDNNSKYDIYNVHNSEGLFRHKNYEIHDDTSVCYDPFYIKAGESKVIPLTICLKSQLSEDEINSIMKHIPRILTINLVIPNEEDMNYSKTVLDSYKITDDDFSEQCDFYPLSI